MIVPVDASDLSQAAAVHAASRQASHAAFCTPDFVRQYTPERQGFAGTGVIPNGPDEIELSLQH